VSHFVEKSVIESGLPARSVEVIYDGVEIPPETSRPNRGQARMNLGIPPDCPCIGNVAAFVPEKGQEILLRSFAKLSDQIPGCILLLCGEGPRITKLQELARQLQIFDAVKFISPILEIQKVFAAIDVFAFPSHEEPLGSALLAAMAHGLPVVAIGRGGIPEVVEDGKNGLLLNSLDPDALAAGIENLLTNPDEALRLGKAARETVSARFSAGRLVDETLTVYENLAGLEN
jgi:glycosyltransferase involved in cell wall biosynthesis